MLKQKSAIVTGSTSGIGLGIARAFAESGADVMLNGFGNADEIEFTRAELQRTCDVRVRYSNADMGKPEQIRAMAEQATREFGKVDIVVNNAGIQHVAPIEEFPDEKWDAIVAINLSSAFHLVKAVVPGMKARRFGRIVNIASAHGLTASPFKSAYVAAKHGLVGLSKTVALELAEFGITSNTICPGYVKTPLVDQQIAGQAKAHGLSEDEVIGQVMLAPAAIKRLLEPAEVADAVAWLCSPSATSVTGTSLIMDGGWSAH